MLLFKSVRYVMTSHRLYQIGAALMFCGVAVAYLYLRFSDMHSLQQTSSLIEVSGVLFLLSLACIVLSVKCSRDLKRVSSSASTAREDFNDASQQQSALMALARSRHIAEGALLDAAHEVTELLSATLSVERASVWLLNEEDAEISCLDLYRCSEGRHSKSESIRTARHPIYFRELNQSRTISISDTLKDPRTKEIRKNYLIPWKIDSTIDSSIRVAGKVVGYVFVGSVGEKRDWDSHEVSFVAAIADQFSQVIANNEKRKTYEALNRIMLTTSTVTGSKFFDMLVCQLCTVLNVKYSMVSEWSEEIEKCMKSLALAVDGKITSPLHYSLENTPCADVVINGFLHIPDRLRQRYPKDDIAMDFAVEGYMGAPLIDSTGAKIGILIVFHTGAIPQPETAKALLEIFAARAAIELERIKTFESLKTNKALLDATLESTADGLLVVDQSGAVQLTNGRFAELWRMPNELIEAGDDEKFLAHVLDQLAEPEQFLKKVHDLYDSDREDFDVVYFKDGRMFERFSCPLLMDGVSAGRVWSFRDITVKERAVSSLQESEDRYHCIFDSSNDGFIIFDEHGRMKEANRAASRMHGWTEEEFLRLEPHQFIHEESMPIFQEFFEHLERGEEFQCIARDICKDGSSIDVEVSGVRLSIGGEVHFMGVSRDITERKRRERRNREIQEKLERAERMQSIGVLAGGVAHDLNNILGPLVAYPELILRKLPDDSPLRERIGLIGESAKHAAEVIQDLLTLSRRGRVELQPNTMNNIVNDVLRLTNFVALERKNPQVKVTVNLDTQSASVNVSKTHLAKAILNICDNAFLAMPDGGELTIETTQVYLERLFSGYSAMQPGNYVGLKICDTGKGMSEEHLSRLFEPYYNKKNVASATSGLGLAIVYGVIKDHGGYYDVISEIGQGTEFIVYLPAVSDEIQPEYLKPSSYSGTETALVVDDDESQRRLACALLESLGYEAMSVANGTLGVEALKARSVDVVVLDMIMEDGFDGLDTYQEMLKINPQQKVVIVTGFATTDRVDEMYRLGAGVLVKKPYTRDAIGKAIRDTLDSKIPLHAPKVQ